MTSIDEIVSQMKSYREDVMRIFYGANKNDIDSLLDVIESEDKRAHLK